LSLRHARIGAVRFASMRLFEFKFSPNWRGHFSNGNLKGNGISGNNRVAPFNEAFRQQMLERVSKGRNPSGHAKEFRCSDASTHACIKSGRR
jgi:hypothetical protein